MGDSVENRQESFFPSSCLVMVNSPYEFLTVFIVVVRFPVASVNKKRL